MKIKVPAVLVGSLWLAAVCPATLNAQTFSVLHSFTLPAEFPGGPLVEGPDGFFYGTASEGGAGGYGTVFKVKPNGTAFTNIYNFDGGLDGANPYSGLVLSGGTLFGTASSGGGSDHGTVFMLDTNGGGFRLLWDFSAGSDDASGVLTNADGVYPEAGLVLSGGALFGTAFGGGFWGNGVVFMVNTNGAGLTVLTNLSAGDYNSADIWTNADGANPYAGLTVAGTNLFGTTYYGGLNGNGTVFKIGTNGAGFSVLKTFSATNTDYENSDGANPFAGLILSGTTLYGAAEEGGDSGNGTVFYMSTNGSGFNVLRQLSAGNYDNYGNWTNADGAFPDGTLLLAGNFLFGTAYGGGVWGNGSVFTINTGGNKFTNLYSFNTGDDGANPSAGLLLSGPTLYGTASAGGDWGAGTLFSVNTNRSGFANFLVFDSTDGVDPLGGLVFSGNAIYGTAFGGGVSSNGIVFEENTNGTAYTILTNFAAGGNNAGGLWTNSVGANPQGDLVLSGGTLFGTATGGGTNGTGAVFSVGTNGSGLSGLWSFAAAETNSLGILTNANGDDPEAGLVLAGGALFGTTYAGGLTGAGTVFTINTNGAGFKVLRNFSAGGYDPNDTWTNADGADPEAALVLAGTNLFGTTYYGGSNGYGTVFMLGTNGGGFTVLKTFSAPDPNSGTNTDGANPYAGLVLSGVTLFGAAEQGGAYGNGTLFSIGTNGSGFTMLWDFSATDPDTATNADGANPDASLMLSGDTLFGTASAGGFWAGGTVFEINTNGNNFVNLHNFAFSTDGAGPAAGLILSGNLLFGTASQDGVLGGGTVFDLDPAIRSPTLTITWSGQTATVSWPSPSTGFVLQQNTDLTTTDWVSFPGSINDDGVTKSASISPPASGIFLRLQDP